MMIRKIFLSVLLCSTAILAHAGLFDDNEARKALFEMQAKIEGNRVDVQNKIESLHNSLQEQQNQIEDIRKENAALRTRNEQLTKELAQLKSTSKPPAAILLPTSNTNIATVPTAGRNKAYIDGKEFEASAAEQNDYEAAFSAYRDGQYADAKKRFTAFLQHYPKSGYTASAQYWLGNVFYAEKSYKEAIKNFQAMLKSAPEHPKASEALLSIANCQLELKETAAARQNFEAIVKTYPKSEAAIAAKEYLDKNPKAPSTPNKKPPIETKEVKEVKETKKTSKKETSKETPKESTAVEKVKHQTKTTTTPAKEGKAIKAPKKTPKEK